MGFEKVVSQPEQPEREPFVFHPCLKPPLPEGAGPGTVWVCDECGNRWVWDPLGKSVVPKMVTYLFVIVLSIPTLFVMLVIFIPMVQAKRWWQIINWRTYQIFCWTLFLLFAAFVIAVSAANV